jgi:hypothetical protein
MKQFLYALTFATALCLLAPGAARGRGVFASPEPPAPSQKEILAEKEVDGWSVYFLGSLASLILTTCVVQFVREVRGGYAGPRIFTYSTRTDRYDEVEVGDDGDEGYSSHDSRYESDF